MATDKMYGFKFFKAVLGFVFKWYYNPKIIGAENIPKDGAIVVVGNHIHIMDQCLPILGTKRPIHYMAKREYFDNKQVAWFFKLSGCIPVDRSIKDDKARDTALEVLRNKQALGLFPEGTRNGLKQEKIDNLYAVCKKSYPNKEEFIKLMKKQKTSYINFLEKLVDERKITKSNMVKNITRSNDYLKELILKNVITEDDYYDNILLPFKFGAVSMAKKTDSLLVPFGITGDYKFRSKNLVVRIGKPFKVGEDLEEANSILRSEIINLMKESMKNSEK